jgi:hypothetical protein
MTKQLPDLLKCSWYIFNVFLLISRIALCTRMIGVSSKTTDLMSSTRMIQHQHFCEVWKMKMYGFVTEEVY